MLRRPVAVLGAPAFAGAVGIAGLALLDVATVLVLCVTGLIALDLTLRTWSMFRRRSRPGPSPDPATESVLLRVLCHELRSPVSSLSSLTRALTDEPTAPGGPDRQALVLLAREQAAHLDGVWRQAVAWTQGVTATGEPRLPLDRILPTVLASWPAHRVRVSVSRAAGHQVVGAQRLRQILLNLVGNALRHGPPDGLVRLAVSVRADDLVFVVADEGTSCQRLSLALRRPAPSAGLSGLGLWIVRRLVAAEGGTIRAYRLRPHGVAVEVTIPLDRSGPTPGPEPSGRASVRAWPVRGPRRRT